MLRFFTYAVFTGVVSWFTCTGCQATPLDTKDTGEAEQADEETTFCGGFANIPCPDGYKCVDNPNDDCDPKSGGADCGGICVLPDPCDQPDRVYMSTDPTECKSLMILCASGMEVFSDSCGCGCEPVVVAQACGNTTCGSGQFCCNASCSMCAPKGGSCIQIACE